ncbi:polyribonucleotide nucleotidyltransferase [Brevinema andersonii]|uniref:Polyribonucleotide nucleotidyltransferase n=1 Tax=Brevinema andersonii TaxID=34097 RepID=A0A1I1DE71_BREAD|nr:polyribonucleotide nucleotidyltransferase [Brevinema andersonii]SFB70833.1 polyribonucleotide nucleotidyltransferase [Brevinema andersonii]
MFDVKTVSRKIGDQEITLETGKLARQAGGSVLVRYAGNAMLVTACASPEPIEGDFFPLTVHFQEKFYAVGRIPGGFFRREAKPSDNATLMARQIDRPIRPLFPKGFRNEVQIIVTLLSSDMTYTTEAMGIIGAVAALAISPIPLDELAGGVKIIWSPDFGYKINPSLADIESSHLDLLVGGTKEGICMVEGGGSEVSEDIILEALRLAHEAILEEISMIEELTALINPQKMEIMETASFFSETRLSEIRTFAYDKIKAVSNDNDKNRRSSNIKAVFQQVSEHFGIDKDHEAYKELKNIFEDVEVEIIRHQIVVEKIRTDGRKLTEIRPIEIELDIFPGLHGSALFTRGQTQSLGIVTLGMPKDEMLIDSVESSQVFTKRFMLHYNFPPFSVGEVKRLGGLSRREIGHGHLAERALIPVLPAYEKFPYTIRFVSEITESNGSSSMASVCSGSLAMMASGVPLKSAVAGIAMGLVWDKKTNNYTILSDIQGLEDHHGDMDFKVAGTRDGITAIQMDLKTAGLPADIMKIALSQAKEGRMHILDIMEKSIAKPRFEVSESAPKLFKVSINPEQIGNVIGSGGRVIKKIMSDFGTEINIEDNGDVVISAQNLGNIQATADMIRKLTEGFKEDEEITGIVTRKEAFGVFVEVLPGIQALLHTSKMKDNKDHIQIGEKITVFFKNIDDKKRINIYQINKDIEPVRKEFHDKKRPPRKDFKKQNSENDNQKK